MLATSARPAGSSPRIRGEYRTLASPHHRCGIIPANTGRMRRSRRMVARRRDHPREYGENSWTTRYRQLLLGSSPRIRGEYRLGTPPYRANRIIPANTGRIIPVPGSLHYRRDHPREYGENSSTSRFHVSDGGSSPRIRGEYAVVVQSPVRVGIIPANTGRILPLRGASILLRDHPREYGENDCSGLWSGITQGSSPRIRGELRYAPSRVRPCWDHPREYGENTC